MERLRKQKDYLKKYFKLNKMPLSLKAMEMALTYHTGMRKGGEKAEVSHQFELVSYALPLYEDNENKDIIVSACFLHDVCEDYDVSFETIAKEFGSVVAETVKGVTKPKEFAKTQTEYQVYYEGMIANAHILPVKACDRLHNLSTMLEVFTLKKRQDYIEEVREFMIPTAKKVRMLYPETYQKVTLLIRLLEMYCSLIETINKKEEQILALLK